MRWNRLWILGMVGASSAAAFLSGTACTTSTASNTDGGDAGGAAETIKIGAILTQSPATAGLAGVGQYMRDTLFVAADYINKTLITGKKVEIYSLPYSSINMWSSENAGGMLDTNAEIEMWTRAGHIKIKLGKGADVRRLDSLIAWAVLK